MNKIFCMAYHAFHCSLLQLNMILLSEQCVIFVSWIYAIYPRITLVCFTFFLVHIGWDPCPRFKILINSLSRWWLNDVGGKWDSFLPQNRTIVTIVAKEIFKTETKLETTLNISHTNQPVFTLIITQSQIHSKGNIPTGQKE